jgi:hypothetical protein
LAALNYKEYGSTAILIIIRGHETAFNGFWYQFTTGKPLRNLKLTLNYYENGSTGQTDLVHALNKAIDLLLKFNFEISVYLLV